MSTTIRIKLVISLQRDNVNSAIQIKPINTFDITTLTPYKNAASPAVDKTTDKISRCGFDNGATFSITIAPAMIAITNKISSNTNTLFH